MDPSGSHTARKFVDEQQTRQSCEQLFGIRACSISPTLSPGPIQRRHGVAVAEMAHIPP
jgi:hypothetical protein